MRCRACDCRLSAYEATRKSATTGEYIDLCNDCFSHISDEVPTINRTDLLMIDDEDDEE